MRTRIIRGLTKQRADEVKAEYEALGWKVEILPEPGGTFQVTATK
jgi:hypothetical protein